MPSNRTIPRICAECEAPFQARERDVRIGYGIVCSRACGWKRNVRRAVRNCTVCDQAFDVPLSALSRPNGGAYCSPACQHAGRQSYSSAKSLALFWGRVNKNGPVDRPELGPCWVWTAANNGHGYGNTSFEGKRYLTHRLSYILAHGGIPDGLDVLHACDNPPCVRPDHLWVGTAKDNGRDMAAKGRVNPASIAALRPRKAKRITA